MLAQASGRGWRRERERVRASVTKDTVARTWMEGRRWAVANVAFACLEHSLSLPNQAAVH